MKEIHLYQWLLNHVANCISIPDEGWIRPACELLFPYSTLPTTTPFCIPWQWWFCVKTNNLEPQLTVLETQSLQICEQQATYVPWPSPSLLLPSSLVSPPPPPFSPPPPPPPPPQFPHSSLHPLTRSFLSISVSFFRSSSFTFLACSSSFLTPSSSSPPLTDFNFSSNSSSFLRFLQSEIGHYTWMKVSVSVVNAWGWQFVWGVRCEVWGWCEVSCEVWRTCLVQYKCMKCGVKYSGSVWSVTTGCEGHPHVRVTIRGMRCGGVCDKGVRGVWGRHEVCCAPCSPPLPQLLTLSCLLSVCLSPAALFPCAQHGPGDASETVTQCQYSGGCHPRHQTPVTVKHIQQSVNSHAMQVIAACDNPLYRN